MTISNKKEVEDFKNFIDWKIKNKKSERGKNLAKMMLLNKMANELGIDSYRLSLDNLTTEEIIKLRKVYVEDAKFM